MKPSEYQTWMARQPQFVSAFGSERDAYKASRVDARLFADLLKRLGPHEFLYVKQA
jgi:hypothetical protein